jgi:hypothetical protein
VVSWTTARQLFLHSSEFKQYPVHKLKTVADRDPRAISETSVKDIFPNWKTEFKGVSKFEEITVMNMTDTITENNKGIGTEDPTAHMNQLVEQFDIIKTKEVIVGGVIDTN